jgi:predicted aldo/keto reductase-like oxidoreductase
MRPPLLDKEYFNGLVDAFLKTDSTYFDAALAYHGFRSVTREMHSRSRRSCLPGAQKPRLARKVSWTSSSR